jgi:hypothetical protein
MGLSPSCLNGLAEQLRLLELRGLIEQADDKTIKLSPELYLQGLNSPARAQLHAWMQYLERLRDEQWALRVRLGMRVTAAAAAAAACAVSMAVESLWTRHGSPALFYDDCSQCCPALLAYRRMLQMR